MNGRVLMVEADRAFAEELAEVIRHDGHEVEVVRDVRAALVVLGNDSRDLVLLGAEPGDTDALDLCRHLKREWRTRFIPVVVISREPDVEQRIRAFDAGAEDVFARAVNRQELLARLGALVRAKRYSDDLDSAASILMSLADLIERRDGHAEGHCHRMANYATALGRRLELGDADLQALHRGGFLHDIGMLAISEGVLHKTERLTPEEYELVKSHTTIGESLCASLRSLASVRPIIRSHHERLDGSGYPDGLRGDAIPLLAQIMGLVDAYEAVTTRRSYRQALPVDQAVDILWGQAARGWRRRDLVEAFVAIIEGRVFGQVRG